MFIWFGVGQGTTLALKFNSEEEGLWKPPRKYKEYYHLSPNHISFYSSSSSGDYNIKRIFEHNFLTEGKLK